MKAKLIILTLLFSALLLVACAPAATAEPTDAPEVEETDAPEVEETEAPDVEETEAPEEEPATEEAAEGSDLSGTIVVLTNRTDLVDTVMLDYAAQFNEIYPNVTVEFEALRDYEGETQIRMNTEDYGDVLLIPNGVPLSDLPSYFEPLGSLEELDAKYMFATEKAYEDQVYGIAVTGNAQGIAYNKRVFEEAGITELPTSPAEFIDAMKLIRDNTDAIPVYTNYAAGWPLSSWHSYRGSVTCNANYDVDLVHTAEPFAEGEGEYILSELLYALVAEGLTEEDPTTTDWELSKQLIGEGDVATMFLGSWSIVQFQAFAPDPDDIGYMPFPIRVDGQSCSDAGGDYKIGINIHSENKEAARAWVDWFLDESNFAYDQGGIPPLKGSDLPPQLSSFTESNVVFITQNPAPAGEEGLLDQIDQEAEIGLGSDPAWRQRLIDSAKGNLAESFEDIMADLNARWAEAQATIVGN